MPAGPTNDPVEPRAPRPVEWVDGPAGRIRVDDGGAGGVPVLFVHGLAGDRTVWREQLDRVRQTRRAIAVDLRGHGESSPSESGDYSIPAFVADVVAVANALKLDRFVLVGHSLGGSVAAGYAGASPERVAGILLADPSGVGTKVPRGEAEAMLRQMAPGTYARFVSRYFGALLEGADPACRERVLRSLRMTRREVVAGAFRGSLSWNPVPSLERYPGPKLAVVSAASRAPWSLTEVMPALPTRRMPGTSHWPMLDRPAEFQGILSDFLSGTATEN